MDFLTERRISLAKELLGDLTLNIAEVALATGFDDPSYFTRRFRQKTGMTPRDVSQAAGARLEVMEKLRPTEVRDLQRQMDSVADKILAKRMANPRVPAHLKHPTMDEVFAAMEAANG